MFFNVTNVVAEAGHINVKGNNRIVVTSVAASILGLPSKNLIIQRNITNGKLYVAGTSNKTLGRPVNKELTLTNASLSHELKGNLSAWNISETAETIEHEGDVYYELVLVRDGAAERAKAEANTNVVATAQATEVSSFIEQEDVVEDLVSTSPIQTV